MNTSTSLSKVSSAVRRLRRGPSFSSTIARPAIIIGSSSVRSFGSGGGTRGARGHGWWVNYRAGKGGRHLQGEYHHLDVDSMANWNDAAFSLGSQMGYLDVRLEAMSGISTSSTTTEKDDDGDSDSNNEKTTTAHRLKLELATTALPRAADNFVKLLQDNDGNADGYLSSTLHRVEKGVGILGGLVTKNPNSHPNATGTSTKTMIGKCHPDYCHPTSMTAMDISSEHLVISHLPGVITMLQPRIGEIDSRYMMLSHHAPHMDGVSVAIGRLSDDSLEIIQKWESTLITSYGVPTNITLRVVGCGLLEEESSNSNSKQQMDDKEINTEKKQVSMES